ncbi:uncharacterized protein PAC_07836 [Phialocephala subalpina]|uniref:Secreted protein n=1 Tax=Phialocephala subalpina TaxID=576137 RepID=A0A1L7WYV0_9HELO|nr:uncharacterized protein PAC_07836 [Phialocephala subalpina]
MPSAQYSAFFALAIAVSGSLAPAKQTPFLTTASAQNPHQRTPARLPQHPPSWELRRCLLLSILPSLLWRLLFLEA